MYGNPAVATYLRPAGDNFIRLIKMIVVPIVLSTLIVGVVNAILFGVLVANVIRPGAGLDMHTLGHADISKYVATTQTATSHSFVDTLVNVVPTNVFQAVVKAIREELLLAYSTAGSAVNVCGNSLAAVVVSKWEGQCAPPA